MLYDQLSLENFRVVVDQGGMRNALSHLPYGMTLSALSRQMSRLEAQWGCILFERQPFTLTNAGRGLYRVASDNHQNLCQFAERVRQVGPKLRIAAPPDIVQEFLVPMVAFLADQDPTFCVVLRSGRPSQMFQ